MEGFGRTMTICIDYHYSKLLNAIIYASHFHSIIIPQPNNSHILNIAVREGVMYRCFFRWRERSNVLIWSDAENWLWEHKLLAAYQQTLQIFMRLQWLDSPAVLSPSKFASFPLSFSEIVKPSKGVSNPQDSPCTPWTLFEPVDGCGIWNDQNKNKQTGESPFRLCCRISWMSQCSCFWAVEAYRVWYAQLSWDS